MQSIRSFPTALLATLVLAAPALAEPAQPPDEHPRLALGYFDAADLPAPILATMQDEVERVLVDAGVAVRTVQEQELTSGTGAGSAALLLRLVVIDRSPHRWGLPPSTMGVRIGRALPATAVQLFAPVILRAVGITNGEIRTARHEEVGRALGRVAVHEIVHAFAPDHRHAGWGIMGHDQDRDSLTRGMVGLDDESAEALVRGIEQVRADVSTALAEQP